MVEKRAERGVPSLVWRAGQQRRLNMIRAWAQVEQACILVDGCGLGAYSAKLLAHTPHVYSFDIEVERVRQAQAAAPMTHLAAAEALPYPANRFDTILSHEVIEHVADDREAVCEMVRTAKPGGRIVVFCPNRWYPFETHGHYWRGQYHFGNTPLINYLPNALRDQLAPHVRAYTKRQLLALFADLPVRVVHHTRIFGAYDNIIKRAPALGKVLRAVLQAAEGTPLRLFGLSHLLIVEKAAP
jgi:SAM-dependent methyltransferase